MSMSEDTRNRLRHSNMTKTITFFIIGFLILGPRECRGLGDPDDTQSWKTGLFYEVLWPVDDDTYAFANMSVLIEDIDNMRRLSVDALCLQPIFPWEHDAYSCNSYTHVSEKIGTMDDITKLIETAHTNGIKVILDVVPFYTSDQHVWFQKWEKNINPYAEFYRSPMKGSIYWTMSSKRNAPYEHQLAAKSPDLNLDMDSVRHQLNEELFTFWLDKGVDGFRIIGRPVSHLDYNGVTIMQSNEKYLNEMRQHVDQWTREHNSTFKYLAIEPLAIGFPNEDSYDAMRDTPGVVRLNKQLLSISNETNFVKSATSLKELIVSVLSAIPSKSSASWMLSDRDHSRLPSRVGQQKAGALTMLMMLLPGQAHVLTADDRNVADSGLMTEYNLKNGPHSYVCTFARITALRKRPVFKRGDYDLRSLNNDAVLVLRRNVSGTVYVAAINLANTVETINLGMYPDLKEQLEILVNTDTNDTSGRLQNRDAVYVPPSAGIVLRSARTTGESGEGESVIDKTFENVFCKEPDKNNSVPKGSGEKPTSTEAVGPGGKGEGDKNGGTLGKGGSDKPSQPGENGTNETGKDVGSPKKEGEARKKEGREGDGRTTGWEILTPVGKVWRTIVQLWTGFWGKKLETAVLPKTYRWNRQ